MSSDTPYASNGTPRGRSQTLTDRVKGRVTEARLALDRSASDTSPASKRLRPKRAGRPASRPRGNSEEERESRSLRRVYSEMRVTYQRYRRQTGRPAVPELREAVHAFKSGPSLTSLVGVAAFLDERGLLSW